ncbi:MAG: hypothetical protein JKY56_12220 [Kofleriaceae bacterium]|nr:hypothetical protein [Kofleriaceae bacterium]
MSATDAKTLPTNTLTASSLALPAAILGGLLGLAMILFGAWLVLQAWSGSVSVTRTLSVSVVVIGAIELAASYYTLKGKRVAWAFMMSINGTAAVVFLFSAPRIRDAADLSLGMAAIPCLLFAIVTGLGAFSSEDF